MEERRKDNNPIKFMFWQTEMENLMYCIDQAITKLKENPENWQAANDLIKVKEAIQHKINMHHEWGEWV